MAISTIRFAQGYGKVKADCSALTGLVSAELRMVNYQYKVPDQPKVIEVCRILEIVYDAPAAVGPAIAPAAAYNFYGLPQSEWTIWVARNHAGYVGPPTDLETLYEMILLECKLLITDTDAHRYRVTFGMTTEKLRDEVGLKM